VQQITGDLIDLALRGHFDVIVHGCNCYHAMGAGIARTIKQVFPEAYAADRHTPAGPAKLGTFSCARVQRGAYKLVIVNAYTQVRWGRDGVLVNYDAVARCMVAVRGEFKGLRIGYPLIGAGLAGGDWARIQPLIDAALAGECHTLVVLP
jgi:O-acetyl-ADP-ribose deacetylase (regulator of RNase III)